MLSVLLVDDDEDLLEMVEMVLENSLINVKTLNSGSGLLKIIEEERPDVLVMDIYLGDADGRFLCEQLKNSEDYKDIPILLYSAGVISPESIKASQANEFLPKPFQIDVLVDKIKLLASAS